MSVQKQLSVDRGNIVQNQGRQAVFGQLLVNGGNQITRKDTQHNGRAADIQITGVPPKKVAAYAETLLPNKGGIGIYGSFTHIDVRDTKSRWNG